MQGEPVRACSKRASVALRASLTLHFPPSPRPSPLKYNNRSLTFQPLLRNKTIRAILWICLIVLRSKTLEFVLPTSPSPQTKYSKSRFSNIFLDMRQLPCRKLWTSFSFHVNLFVFVILVSELFLGLNCEETFSWLLIGKICQNSQMSLHSRINSNWLDWV